MNVVRLDDVAATPWRNGGGATRELLAWPRADRWRLRVSVARIEREGPFSPFPGVQRWFAVLGGGGVRLQHRQAMREQREGDAAWCFDGADAPHCTPLDGPTDDLNFMLRHDAGHGVMEPLRGRAAFEGRWCWWGVYAAEPISLRVDGEAVALSAGTLAWSDEPELRRFAIDDPASRAARGWWLSVDG